MKEKASVLDQDVPCLVSNTPPRAAYRIRRETGAIAIMAALLLPVILGMFILAFDLARVYNRRVEMQILADVVAIAAAKRLDGTSAGISAAAAAARAVVEDAANGPQYAYMLKMTWEDTAITFSASLDGSSGWKTVGEAVNSPAGLMYVKADTKLLTGNYGKVKMLFAPIFASSLSSINADYVSIAGKSRRQVTPLAVCAMSTTPHARRENKNGTQYDELVEYGFRRGVGYNLMKLNPNGTNPMSFQVDPIALADGGSTESNFDSSIFGVYVCTGTMMVPKVTGASVVVRSLFPIATYSGHLNSRFDPYTGTCDVNTSPPDSNVKQYPYASVSWMSTKATAQVANPDPASTRLQTVAEIGPVNHPTAGDYGALWTFARAVPWLSFEQQGSPEPAAGYTPFDATTATWSKLYGSASAVGTYPGSAPYLMTNGASYFQTPTTARRPGTSYRRVLNIPLLSCPVTGSTATVLAIGKFLMTVPADSTSVYAEFGGITSEDQIGGPVEIYQ